VKLVGQKGPAAGHQWVIKSKRLTVGRDATCDIFLDDPKVSRLHAEISRSPEGVMLVDNNSTNGSFVDGMRVTEAVLREGQVVRFGTSELLATARDPTESVEIEDSQSSITMQVPVESLREAADLARPQLEADLRKAAEGSKLQLDGRRLHSVLKLLRHLDTIYDLSATVGSTLSPEQLQNSIVDKVTAIFPQAERTCLLLEDPKDKSEFLPVVVRSRERTISGEFRISRSILKRTITDKVAVLATDAIHDDRFQAADSIVNMQLKSAICAPMLVKGEPLGAIYMDNCTQPFCFDRDDLELLGAFAVQAGMAIRNAQLYDNIQRSYHQSILALINTIEAKDPYTMGHTQRTMRYALGIARHAGMNDSEIKTLRMAAQLHDIGKIGVKENILQKSTKLTDEEYGDMKNHVLIGVRILEPIEYLRDIIPIVRGHHEKFDGSGYPDGAKGEEIPLGARVLALADAFDAMTTQRPYNRPLSFQQALEKCREGAGKHFDPECVEALGSFLDESAQDRPIDLMSSRPENASAPAGVSEMI